MLRFARKDDRVKCSADLSLRHSRTKGKQVDRRTPEFAPSANVSSGKRVGSSTIPDNDPAGISDTISVSHGGTIADVIVLLDIEHTYMWELIVTLTHVSTGTSVELMDHPRTSDDDECGTNDFNGRLDDTAALNVNDSC